MILDGELDEVPENDFYMQGSIEGVINKRKNLNATLPRDSYSRLNSFC